MSATDPAYTAPPLKLDSSFYHLTDEEKAFFQQLTGIIDDEELKAHIISVQTKADSDILVYGVSHLFSASMSQSADTVSLE
ncbi:hypothetical protein D9619_004545 [Psilocybe cf. subviscida]|uniref:Uncharacterized protein n=1 Tax=Psilocybe cf. subviscida TaxID=2480587 RepID=A0A8H5BQF5_9AGAR|nr:hypothetical protein D9619_004545 [Psilocybe cf. subviscida]